jgi:N-acyl homoserine lactone hydrolase
MLRIYALCGGYLDLDRASMLPDGTPSQRWTVPVPCYLIVHPQGHVLFDTGVHCQALSDPLGRLGKERAQRIGIKSQVGDDVVSELARLGLRPADIRYVVNSHFHFDHCGGNEYFPQSTFLVQRSEMAAARSPEVLAQGRYSPNPIDFDHALDYQFIDGEHDVFGDGTVILIPTYGHTPGHQSLLVRLSKDSQMVFTADACYTQENMDRDLLPRVVWDPDEMSQALARLRTLRDKHGARLFYGHDPGQWQTLQHTGAPVALA